MSLESLPSTNVLVVLIATLSTAICAVMVILVKGDSEYAPRLSPERRHRNEPTMTVTEDARETRSTENLNQLVRDYTEAKLKPEGMDSKLFWELCQILETKSHERADIDLS